MRCVAPLLPLLLAACAAPPAPLPRCMPDAALDPAPPYRGVPVETTAAGRCLAARAQAGDSAASLALGDYYRALPGTLPLIDRNGREVHWYRLAADHGSAAGAWMATLLIDTDPDRQVPNDALAYLFEAVRGGIPEAGDRLIDQWQAGRIDPGKLWAFRRWLATDRTLDLAARAEIVRELAKPPVEPLEEE